MPSRSIRWPPVILTSGTSYLSATSAIRRSSSAVVTPPRIRGTTRERAVVLDVRVDAVVDEARVALLAVAVAADLARRGRRGPGLQAPQSRPGAAGARRARETESMSRSRDHRGQLLARLAAGTGRGRSASSAAPPRSIASSSATSGLHEPQPGARAGDADDLQGGAEAARCGSRRRSRPCRRRCSCRPARRRGGRRRSPGDASASSASGSLAGAAGPHRVEQQLGAARVAEQDRADRAAVRVDDQLAVASALVGDRRPPARRRRRRRRRGRRPSPSAWPSGSSRRTRRRRRDQRARRPPPARGSARRSRARRRGAARTRRPRARSGARCAGGRRRRSRARRSGRRARASVGLRADADRDHDEVAPRARDRRRSAAATRPSASVIIARCARSSSTSTPSASHRGREQRRGAAVELALHQAVHEVHDRRRAAERGAAAWAASSPSSPPPITPRAGRARRVGIAAQSSGPRKTWTPGGSAPGIGGTSASLPVQRTARSKAIDSPSVERREAGVGVERRDPGREPERRSRGRRTTPEGAAQAPRASARARTAACRG